MASVVAGGRVKEADRDTYEGGGDVVMTWRCRGCGVAMTWRAGESR